MASLNLVPENAHSLEKKAKERKEKKKKQEKIADASDHAETRPEIAKRVRTKKETVDSGTPAEPEPAPFNPEEKEKKKRKRKRDRDDEVPPFGDKKEKQKRKKENASDATSDPASTVLATDLSFEVADSDTSKVAGTTMAASEVKEKKRPKKNKSPTLSAIKSIPTAGAADKLEKPLQRKPVKNDTMNANTDAEPSSESKSKSKKRKKRRAIDDEDQSTVSPTEDSSRKRKKSKKSVYPDPSDDPDLTEQSQKALTYVYSQSTSPETWKFNKARQNWIIRNVWTSRVPEKYVPMVVDYLSTVQGQVRETLVESCNKIISDSNVDPPVSQAGTDEKGPPEKLNPPAPNTIGSERTQRVYILLHALTKKS